MKGVACIALLLSACAGGWSRFSLEGHFRGVGVGRYFLTELPDWANASEAGGCVRESSAKFLKLDDFRKSFSLGYAASLQFQYAYNVRKAELGDRYVSLHDEERLFYELLDGIKAQDKAFRPPEYRRVHLVWIDEALRDKRVLGRLKKMIQRKPLNLGHPVFVGLCPSRQHLRKFVQKHFPTLDIRLISFELFSPYDHRGNLLPTIGLDFDQLLPAKKVHFFSPVRQLPREFRGKFEVVTY